MTVSRTIGLLLNPVDSWIAGTYYIINILRSISYLQPQSRPMIKLFVKEGTPEKYFDMLDKSLFQLVTFEHNKLFDYVHKEKVDILYPVSSRSDHNATFKTIGWIPDFQYKDIPQNFSNEQLKKLNEYYETMVKYSDGIILSSNSMFERYQKFFPAYKDKVKIFQFTSIFNDSIFTDNVSEIKNKYNLPDKFFMIANQFWKHKDHLTAFRAINELIKSGINIKVFCTGALEDNRDPDYIKTIENFISDNNLAEYIITLGFIPREDQLKIMQLATAVIQPSLYEGWSTVVEDSKHLGKILFLSDIDVHLEQKPNTAIYFQAGNPEDLFTKISGNWEMLSSLQHTEDSKNKYTEEIKNSAKTFINICNDFCATT